MMETQLLLNEFVERGSEGAFRQLVTQYVDLVYSTALRRSAGDAHRAEDIAQTVFVDLARKAGELPKGVMLGGWLHKHCCFVASNFRRAEARRAAREKEAVAMDATQGGGGEANWSAVAPELDEAIETLEAEDRDAIILRFFEQKNFRAIGEAFGGSENAAQKRVARAIEKLRGLLSDRGVTLSVAALTAGLASESVLAAPGTLSGKASAAALKNGVAKTAVLAGGVGAMSLALWIGAALVVGAVLVGVVKKSRNTSEVVAENAAVAKAESAAVARPIVQPSAGPVQTNLPTNATAVAAVAAITNGLNLELTIVAADSGQVIPNVPISYRATEGTRWVPKAVTASRMGIISIPFTTNTTELQITTRVEGFADTRLRWVLKRGDVIPANYTLRLERGKRIGGKVVNERGELVAGASVSLSIGEDAEANQQIESHEFGSVDLIAEDGNWTTERVAEDVVRRIYGRAKHPEYADSEFIGPQDNGEAVQQMLARQHVFKLNNSALVRGIVLDPEEKPVANASVSVGALGESRTRTGTSGPDGRFSIQSGKPGPRLLTAAAKGFAATTIRITSEDSKEHRLVLQHGRVLKLRVVNKRGEPVPGVSVMLNTMSGDPEDSTNAPLPQVQFSRRTDEEGRVRWDEAPAEELMFDFAVKNYVRLNDRKVRADGEEQSVTLQDALRIWGTVRDAVTGVAIPKFRVVGGYPSTPPTDPVPVVRPPEIFWSPIDRHWVRGVGGKFEHVWEEVVVSGVTEKNFIFKFEADGYRSFVTRVVKEGESDVQFDVALQPVKNSVLTVVDANGQPVRNADVAFMARLKLLQLDGPNFQRNYNQAIRSTDAKGQVPLENEDSIVQIVAASPVGFGVATPAELAQEPVLRLQAWGRVEGRLIKRGKAVPNVRLMLRPDLLPQPTLTSTAVFINTGQVVTDAEGNFTFPFAPPGKFKVTQMEIAQGPDRPWSEPKSVGVEIRPGQTTSVVFDDLGIGVKVRLALPAGFQRAESMPIYCSLNSVIPGFNPEMMKDREAMAQWQARPEVREAMHRARHISFIEIEPGVWASDSVDPGRYTLTAIVRTPNPKPGVPMAPLLQAAKEVEVPNSVSEGHFDLGTLALAVP